MKQMSLPPRTRVTEFVTFVSIITAVALLLLAVLSWFDAIDAFDKQVRECNLQGKQMVKVLGQASYSCMSISPR